MKHLFLVIFLFMLAGNGHATFEISDPANQIIEDLQNSEKGEAPPPSSAGGDLTIQKTGSTACSKFMDDQKGQTVGYWSALNWLEGYVDGADAGLIKSPVDTDRMALWIADYCSDNPSDELAEAASTFVQTQQRE